MTACFLSLIQNLIVKIAKNHEKRMVVPRENQERMAFQPCRKAKRMTNLCKAAILLIYGFLCGYLQTNRLCRCAITGMPDTFLWQLLLFAA